MLVKIFWDLSISFISFPVCCNEKDHRLKSVNKDISTLLLFYKSFLCILAFVFPWSTQKCVVVVLAEPCSIISAGLESKGWLLWIGLEIRGPGYAVALCLRTCGLWTRTLIIFLSFQNPDDNLPFCPLHINAIFLPFYSDGINVREECITSLLNLSRLEPGNNKPVQDVPMDNRRMCIFVFNVWQYFIN